jgi:hypothetical protein
MNKTIEALKDTRTFRIVKEEMDNVKNLEKSQITDEVVMKVTFLILSCPGIDHSNPIYNCHDNVTETKTESPSLGIP